MAKTLKFCGVEIQSTKGNGLCIHQEAYLQSLLVKHDMGHLRSAKIIMDKNECIQETLQELALEEPPDDADQLVQIRSAQKFIGELNWISQRTRPDITYSISKAASLALSEPRRAVLICKKILRYLSSTRSLAIHFPSSAELDMMGASIHDQSIISEEVMMTYTDASFAPTSEELPDMKSNGGVIVMWAGAPLAWLSQRQPLITLSSAEAELVEGIEGHLFSLNVETLLADLQCKVQRQLMLDNTSAISLATTQDKSCSWRTRHLRLRALALREQHLLGTVQVRFCPGNEQLADILTKSLGSQVLEKLREMLGLRTLVALLCFQTLPTATATVAEAERDIDNSFAVQFFFVFILCYMMEHNFFQFPEIAAAVMTTIPRKLLILVVFMLIETGSGKTNEDPDFGDNTVSNVIWFLALLGVYFIYSKTMQLASWTLDRLQGKKNEKATEKGNPVDRGMQTDTRWNLVGGFVGSYKAEWEVVGSAPLPNRTMRERVKEKTVHRDKHCSHLASADYIYRITGECITCKNKYKKLE